MTLKVFLCFDWLFVYFPLEESLLPTFLLLNQVVCFVLGKSLCPRAQVFIVLWILLVQDFLASSKVINDFFFLVYKLPSLRYFVIAPETG